MSGTEIIEKMKEVRETQTKIRSDFPNIEWPEPVLEPIFYGRFDKNPVINRKLMMDANTGIQFDIVSDQYDLIPHEVATHNLLQAIPAEFGKPELKFRMWADGARFRLEATFPELDKLEVKPGDPVQPKIIQTNSLDRSTFYGFEFGATQLVCSNGMIAYKMESKTQRRHVLGASDLSELTENMLESVKNFSEQVGIWSQWAQINIADREELEVQIEDLKLSENEQKQVLMLPIIAHERKSLAELFNEKKATLWDVGSALTQYTTHEVKSEQKAFDLERKTAEVLTKISRKAA